MISIEEITDAQDEQQKPVQVKSDRVPEATAAEASEHNNPSVLSSPETDANAEQDGRIVPDSNKEDMLVCACTPSCKLKQSLLLRH